MYLVGHLCGLSPAVVTADGEGRVWLNAATAERIAVEVPGYRQRDLALAARRVVVSLEVDAN